MVVVAWLGLAWLLGADGRFEKIAKPPAREKVRTHVNFKNPTLE
jgi:hypothetical protein